MYASVASQTSPAELLVNGSSLRSEAQEFCPAVGSASPAEIMFDAREWYASIAAYSPDQFPQYAQPPAQPESAQYAQPPEQPDANETPVSPVISHARAGFVERTARWIHGRARAAACLFVAAVAAIATKRDQLREQFQDVFGGAGAADKEFFYLEC